MKNIWTDIWFPVALIGSVATTQLAGPHERVTTYCIDVPEAFADTVIYPLDGYKRGWSEDEKQSTVEIADSLLNAADSTFGALPDSLSWLTERPAAMDSLVAPDSLRQTDTFFFRYYPAIKDSACRVYVTDSLKAAGDTLDWPRIDSLYVLDSTEVAQKAFELWYAGLSEKERKQYDEERMAPILQARRDSIQAIKDEQKAVKDSIRENTPRILNSYFVPDTLQYKRIISWTHERDFHELTFRDTDRDTTYDYRFNDFPFLRKDVNAVWLGLAGSPLQYHNFFLRRTNTGAYFYEPLESWSYTPETLPMYNTKTPYTELSYSGTLFSSEQRASHNVHVFTTQNITPALNLTLGYERFGSEGQLTNQATGNKNYYAYVNHVGDRYLMHAGYLHNSVTRAENGGIIDNAWIRDTTVDTREIDVYLTDAKTVIKKNTVFLDQQYRIPLSFFRDLFQKKEKEEPEPVPEEEEIPYEMEQTVSLTQLQAEREAAEAAAALAAMTPPDNENVTTAFIGHSSEFTRLTRLYTDKLSSASARRFYPDQANYSQTASSDSIGVTSFNNKLFIRLQPWAREAVVSKLDVGIGEDISRYATFDPTYLYKETPYIWKTTYAYAGVEGQLKDFIHWDALGHLHLIGDKSGDFDIRADARLQFFPFRRARTSPVSLGLHFETSLEEPEYYAQHLYMNHYRWENDFSKISTTKLQGSLSIPYWKLGATVGYALLANNLYYDTASIIRQNEAPMSILSATLQKDLALSIFHLDHRVLFQLSSKPEVIPLPLVSANARYYMQFPVKEGIMNMQVGANVFWFTKWNLPSWNPNVGVFYNQTDIAYGNAPYIDAFVNMQWSDVSLFVKFENVGMGWPLDHADYFSANHYIRTPRVLKIGIFWPFHPKAEKANASAGSGSSANSSRSSSGTGRASGTTGSSSGRSAFGSFGSGGARTFEAR